MTPIQRLTVDRTLNGLIAEYGAWAVLHRTTALLKPRPMSTLHLPQ